MGLAVTKDEILVQLTEVFRDVFERPELVLTPFTSADDIPDWDSVYHIKILVAVERRFGIRFESTETDPLTDIGEFCDLIYDKLGLAKRP